MTNHEHPDFEEIFPVGAQVRFENECFPGHWDYGVVLAHRANRYGENQWLALRPDGWDSDTAPVEYDYRYLDADMRRSMVKLVK